MTTTTATRRTVATSGAVRNGATLMAVAAAGFIGYAVLFLVRNFTDSFLELGIGQGEVNVSKEQIQQFSPSLYHYISHLHIAVSGVVGSGRESPGVGWSRRRGLGATAGGSSGRCRG